MRKLQLLPLLLVLLLSGIACAAPPGFDPAHEAALAGMPVEPPIGQYTGNYIIVLNESANWSEIQDRVVDALGVSPVQVLEKEHMLIVPAGRKAQIGRGQDYISMERMNTQLVSVSQYITDIREETTFHADLAEAAPMLGAPAAWDIGYNGTGVKVCIIDTGIDYFSTQLPPIAEATTFVTTAWCESGPMRGAGAVMKYKINVPSAQSWREFAVWWWHNESRYDLKMYYPNGTLAGDTAGVTPFEDPVRPWHHYSRLNISMNVTGVYTAEIDYTVGGGGWPVLLWGTSAYAMHGNYSFTDGCSVSPNPVTAGDPRAFYNIYPGDDESDSHGTHVAGIIAKQSEPRGIAPGVTLYIAKALDGWGAGTESGIASAITWCMSKNVSIVSMSLGADGGCGSVPQSMIDTYGTTKPLFVVAAGNSGGDIADPGCAAAALTVGAVDKSGNIAYFSAHGYPTGTLKPEVVAPGVDIYSTVATDTIGVLSGTSMATPMVTGVAAIVYQNNPSLPASVIKAMIMASANGNACDNYYGCGMPNATKAMSFDYKIGEMSTYMKKIVFNNPNRDSLDMLATWDNPAISMNLLAINGNDTHTAYAVGTNWTAQKINTYSNAPEQWNVTLFSSDPTKPTNYVLVYPSNYSVLAEYNDRKIRKGYTEPIFVTIQNNNPIMTLYLSGLSIEAWNSTSMLAQLYVDPNEGTYMVLPGVALSKTYNVYIPKNLPDNTFLKVRVFRRLNEFNDRLYWQSGLEGDAVNDTAKYTNYDDSAWLPYTAGNVNFPSVSRLYLPESTYGLVVEPYPTNLACAFYRNGVRATTQIDWNSTMLLYSACPALTMRENAAFESFEITSYEISDPDKPPFTFDISNNTIKRGYFQLLNLSITNNQLIDLNFDFVTIELVNTTSNTVVATLSNIPSPSIPPLSSQNFTVVFPVPDSVPIGDDIKVRATAQRLEYYDIGFASLASSMTESQALDENFDDTKWPVQWPKFSTWHRRHIWADNETSKMEVSLYHSYSFQGYRCDDFQGTLRLYAIYNGTKRFSMNFSGAVASSSESCSSCDMSCWFFTSKWSSTKVLTLGDGPNLVALYIGANDQRLTRSDSARKPAYPVLVVGKRYFTVERMGGGIIEPDKPPFSVDFGSAGNGTLRRGYYELVTLNVTNNNPIAIPLNSISLSMVAPDKTVPLSLDGLNYNGYVNAEGTTQYSALIYVPTNVLGSSLEAEATFSYDLDAGWKRTAPPESVIVGYSESLMGTTPIYATPGLDDMKRYGYNDSGWVVSKFAADQFHRKRFFIPISTTAIDFMARGMSSIYDTWNGSSTVSTLLSPSSGNDYFWTTKKGNTLSTQRENALSFSAGSTSSGKEGVSIRVYFNYSASIPINTTKLEEDAVKGSYQVNETIRENVTYPVSLQYTNNLEWPVYAQTMIAIQDKVLRRNEYLLGDTVYLPADTRPPGLNKNVFVPGNRRYFSGYNYLESGSTSTMAGCDGDVSVATAAGSSVSIRSDPITTDNTSYLGFVFKGGQSAYALNAQWYINSQAVITQSVSNGAGSWSSSGFTLTFMPCERFKLSNGSEYVYGTYFLFAPISNNRSISFSSGSQVRITVSTSSGFVALERTNACSSVYDFCGSLIGTSSNSVLIPIPFRFASEFDEKHDWRRAYVSFSQASNPTYDASYWPVDRIDWITPRSGSGKQAPPYTYRMDMYVQPSTKDLIIPRTSTLSVNGQTATTTSVYQTLNLGDMNSLVFSTSSTAPYARLITDYIIPTYHEPLLIYEFSIQPEALNVTLITGNSETVPYQINNTGNRALDLTISSNASYAVSNLSFVHLGPGEYADFQVTFDTAGLALTNYSIGINGSDINAGNVTANVSLAVVLYDYRILPPSKNITVLTGDTDYGVFILNNSGNLPLDINISVNDSTVVLDRTSVSLLGFENATIGMTLNTTGVPIGVRPVLISAIDANAGGRDALYTYLIALDNFTLSPASQSFSVVAGDTVVKTVTAYNSGNRPLTISLYTGDPAAVPNVTSITLQPGTSADIGITLNTAGMPLGQHSIALTATDPRAGAQSAILSFVVESSQRYAFTLMPPFTTFAIGVGDTVTAPYHMVNTGNRPINISISFAQAWSLANATSFQLVPGQGADFNVLYDTALLAPGSYSETVSANGGFAGTEVSRTSIDITGPFNDSNRTGQLNISNRLLLWVDTPSVCYPDSTRFRVTDYMHDFPIEGADIRVYSVGDDVQRGLLITSEGGNASGSFQLGTYYSRAYQSGSNMSFMMVFSVRNCTENGTEIVTPINETNNTNVTPPILVDVNITAPPEVEVNSTVAVKVVYANGTPLANGILEVTDSQNRSLTYSLNSRGETQFTASREGFYTYDTFGYHVLSTVITYAYVPEAGPEMKTLVIPFYVTEPNKVQLEVSSLGKPQMANIRVQGPMNVENSTNAIGIFTTTITQPGKYVIVVTASNVKSLSAQLVLNRTAFQQTSTDQNIWILAVLVLVTLVAAYLFRKKILSMFMKGRFASVRISPEKPKPKQPVEIRFTADGKPIAGAKVTVLTFKGDAYTYMTRADGTIIFIPVEVGTYRLAIGGHTIFGSDEFEVR